MPVFLIVLVGFGLAIFVALAFIHGATSRPYPEMPVSERRMRQLWLVDDEDSAGQDL